jgi:hypothetical protein
MRKVINWLFSSFDNHSKGASARKFSAFIAVIVSVYITIKLTVAEYLEGVLMIWLGFALLCLSVITVQEIIKLKNGGKAEPEPDNPPRNES